MNPPNPFGRPQGGAFQAPSNTTKTGLFQKFGQQSSNNQPQTMEVFQPSVFGQPPGLIQPSSHGNTMFGQAPVFGQPSAQQAPAFGQPSVGASSSGFGSGTAPAFGQTSGLNQTSVFGQPSAFGQAAGFSQQAPAFGQTQLTSGSTTTLSQSQPVGFGKSAFGQSAFGQPASTNVTTVFTRGNSVMQSKPLGPSKFSFKPATEALFKPIFSASPESTNPQTTSMSSSPFGSSGNQTTSSSTTTTGFSLLTSANPGPMGFSFSLPAAAPSISTQNNPPTTSNSGGPLKKLQFTFSQPAPPSSSSTTNASTAQPTTPSSFSFSIKAPQIKATPLFEGTGFGQRSAFGDSKGQTESITDEKKSSIEALEDTNVFARLGKGTKRKDDPALPNSSQEKPATVEDVLVEAESSRHPPKRPLMRSHGPSGGLFGRALSGLRKEGVNLGRREATKEPQQQAPKWDETEREDVQGQDDDVAATAATAQTATKDVLEKAEQSEATNPEFQNFTPVKRGIRRESTESLGSMSSIDCTVLYCRNIPPKLNRKNIIEKHFTRFGKVSKVICRPAKNIAFIYFDDHASAAQAKKKGKVLHQHELILLWQRKKQSPGEKESRSAVRNEEEVGKSPEDTQSRAASSPFRRTQLRAAEGSNTMTFRSSSPAKKIPSTKSLQFTNEPQKVSGTESQSLEQPVPSSLLHLIGQVAETTEDKYRLLEQRDKELRQGRPKRTDLNLSKVFVGTCPDMCPEKERYMRETRNQLSIFEVIPSTEMVDHTAAIKEYSRSSADKEEPLPNELRPLPVLSMTMDYLVTQIMDQGHDNYRDWYDFVWNRTRGIRKDITQQHLCCPQTVSLIEKCTRFHVHCAHHLCEQHMSAFDPKINNENMTKCLQSLKEMYQDLALHQIYCSQEAEFRQYSVLLRLNDGDILREVQQFRDEVRNSSEAKFAVQVFAALNSNNFVRFFKLVKGASYLASCLLHRYFNQVRAKALQILNIAHTVGPRSTAFPVEDITRMLMFRTTAEAADFIQQYGLNVNEGMVELSRTSYQEPELPLSQKKSEVILAKKTMLIGEVVNGGPLPNPPQHVPICSFDTHNKYRGEVTLAEPTTSQFKALTARLEVKASPSHSDLLPQVTSLLDTRSDFGLPPAVTNKPTESHYILSHAADAPQLFQPISQSQPVKSPSPPPLPPPPVYSDEEIRAELDLVIEEVIEAALREVADVGVSYAKTALVESSVQVESLVGEVLGQMLQEVSSTEIKLEQERVAEEKRKHEEARRRQEHEAFLDQFSASLCTELIHEVMDETIKHTSKSELQQALNEKAQRVAKCTEQVCTSLLEETLNADIAFIVKEILDVELQRIHKYIKMWRDGVAVRRQLKRQMRGFPAAPCCVDPRFKLKALAPSAPVQPSLADLTNGVVNLGNAGTLALSSTRLLKMRQEAIHQMRVHYFHQLLLDEMAWAPLDLPALVTENIPDPPVRIFWKLALLLPSHHDSEASLADGILSDWLEVKLGGEGSEVRKAQPDGTLQTLCVTNTLQEKGHHTHMVHISIKACRGPLTQDSLFKIEEIDDLSGTGALIMLLPTMSFTEPGRDEQDVPLLSALLQLKQLQQANSWHCPLPLVILVPGPDGGADDEQKLEEALMLHTLVQEGLISEFMFFFIPETTSDIQGSKQLSSAICWLLARAPPSFPLSCTSLVEFVEASLSREFNSRVHSHYQERAAAHLPPQEPTPIIQLYNAVLVHTANIVSSKDLCKIAWPPGEFSLPENRHFVPHLGYNSPEHLSWLRKAILSLQLPQWEQLSSTDSWLELCSSIYHYAAQIPVSRYSQPLLMSRLENLLEKVRVQCHGPKTPRSPVAMRRWDSRNGDVFPAYSQVPWEDVLVICIDQKLKDWQIPGPPVCEDAVTMDGEILVYFPTKAPNAFQPPEEWTQAIRQTHREKQQQEEERGASAAACITPSSLSLRQRLFPSLVDTPESLVAPLDITHTPTAQELLAHKLLQSVEEEKAESKRSMEQLQHWLNGDLSDQLSTPLFLPSSILLTMPTTIIRSPALQIRDGGHAQGSGHLTESRVRAEWPTKHTTSFELQLKELERQILASQEEELACRLELSGLRDIVDD